MAPKISRPGDKKPPQRLDTKQPNNPDTKKVNSSDTKQPNHWNAAAGHYVASQEAAGKDGNDMFTEVILPTCIELSDVEPGQTVLELGSGNGIVCRHFRRLGAEVVGLDYSQDMLVQARTRDKKEGLTIDYGIIDLTDAEQLSSYTGSLKDKNKKRKATEPPFREWFKDGFDIITISMTVKSLPGNLKALAQSLPGLLKPNGRVIIIDLHPAFMKPAGHRVMEIFENEQGDQVKQYSVKVNRYLKIDPVKSKAVQTQENHIVHYHRPIWSLLEPFFEAKLAMDCMREKTFQDNGDPDQLQSYHNFPQIPMLLAVRLRHAR